MIRRFHVSEPEWRRGVIDALREDGCALVLDVLDAPFLKRTREALYTVRDRIREEIGDARLRAAGEIGTLRLPFKFDEHFFRFLTLEPVLHVVDATVGDSAILHLLNGFILPPERDQTLTQAFQTTYHRDFPRYLNGYVASVNTFFAIDNFTEENGPTSVLVGSHQRADAPSEEELRRAEPALGPAGTMLVFDSTLWHAAGQNRSSGDRLAVNLQFTRSFIKQQIDYVRALGDAVVLEQPARAQQLLGWYTRVVTSLDEFYQPEERRLYRRHQG